MKTKKQTRKRTKEKKFKKSKEEVELDEEYNLYIENQKKKEVQ